MDENISNYHRAREHQRIYRRFEDWLQGQMADLEMNTAYSFRPRDFLTNPAQDWDSLLDGGSDGTLEDY